MSKTLESQEELIREKEWDTLIILDACRYDFFEKNYRDYLSGSLEKVKSPASITGKWANKVFREYYDDVVYVSANPHINSTMETCGFKGSDHFHEVVDVWSWGWNEKIGTVHPETVNKAFFKARREFSGKKFIIHYEQPHAPYLSLVKDEKSIESKNNQSFNLPFEKMVGGIVELIGREKISKFRKDLNLNPLGPQHLNRSISWIIRSLLRLTQGRQKYGMGGIKDIESDERLRKAYGKNLRIALEYVKIMIDKVNGKIVVTADHGELLGENNEYGHPPDSNKPEQREVPWFTTESRGIGLKEKTRRKIGKLKGKGKI